MQHFGAGPFVAALFDENMKYREATKGKPPEEMYLRYSEEVKFLSEVPKEMIHIIPGKVFTESILFLNAKIILVDDFKGERFLPDISKMIKFEGYRDDKNEN